MMKVVSNISLQKSIREKEGNVLDRKEVREANIKQFQIISTQVTKMNAIIVENLVTMRKIIRNKNVCISHSNPKGIQEIMSKRSLITIVIVGKKINYMFLLVQ